MTHILHDFHKDAFARLKLILTGKGGERVSVAIGECLKDGDLDPAPGGSRYYAQRNIVLKPGTCEYRFPIPAHVAPNPALRKCHPPKGGEIAPFRYARIEGYSGKVEFIREEIHAKFDDTAAEFECSNANLNRIWEFCKYSIKATTAFGMYIDGNRERLPYEGDAYINQLGHFCLDRNYRIAKSTISRLFTNPTWPTEWQLLMPVIVRDYWLYSGDHSRVELWRARLEKSLLPQLMGGNGLIHGSEEIRDLVDWPVNERDGYEFGQYNLVPNCYLYNALNAMFDLYGDVSYRRQALAVKTAIRKHLLKDGVFIDSVNGTHASLHSAIFAVAFGVAEPGEYPKLARFIRSKGMACSVFCAQFLLEACYLLDMPEYALELMTSETLRSWNNMLEKGATITMEAWDDSFKPNQDWNHAWGAAPANIITRQLCGIRPASPGFGSYVVAPHFDGLKFARCVQPLPDGGAITVEFDGKDTLVCRS
ncbi:MAG: hypothetical protein PHI35_06405 [Victivallaceae bacterium]|nr:hypothetical protein [Victivallaceae bacterium]